MQPSPRPAMTPTRIMAITTGTTRCYGARTSTTSPITGPGLIYGKGLSFGSGPARVGAATRGFGPERPTSSPAAPPPRPLRLSSSRQLRHVPGEQAGVGNKAIALKNCRNVIFRDFSLLKGRPLRLSAYRCRQPDARTTSRSTRTAMAWILIAAGTSASSNCTVNSPWERRHLPQVLLRPRYNRATENVNITNCFVTGAYRLGTVLDGTWKKFDGSEADFGKIGGTGRIKCGTESNGGFKNITISNCVFEGCQGLALETRRWRVAGGHRRHQHHHARRHPRARSSCASAHACAVLKARWERTSRRSSELCAVFLSPTSPATTRLASTDRTLPAFQAIRVEDLKISDVYVEHVGGGTAEQAKIDVPEKEDAYPEPGMLGALPAHGFYFRHVNRLEMSHVEVQPKAADARPAIYTDEVHRADSMRLPLLLQHLLSRFNKSSDIRCAAEPCRAGHSASHRGQ